ncbi:phage major capsid protein [Phaeobacter inhibens]|uniref:phage major capsid protein n=1 Tax=Phaeobacter inhibens TaxID=221822 RepID=UPI0021A42A61|nr:phage major capsid protein [Phaeobacter inhibens]UWR59117.1 phage major capsid protein [Phaeobacter inhibens]
MSERIEIKAQIAADEAGVVSGIAWPFSPDSVGDVIEKGAFSFPAALPICMEHDQGQVVGTWENFSETDRGLEVKGRLFVEGISPAEKARRHLKAGVIAGLSIAFRHDGFETRADGGRTFKAVTVTEISLCKRPVHPAARITEVKAIPQNLKETPKVENEEIETEEKAVTPANDTPQVPQVDTKAFNEIKDRLNRLEAKGNRPRITGPANPVIGNDEVKAFTHYLSTGEKKSLTAASDTSDHILAPDDVQSEFIRNLVEFSPIRSIADVKTTERGSVILPKRTGVTNAAWVDETTVRTGSEPAFGQASIAIKEIATYVDVSLQLAEDSDNVLSEVNLALAEDFAQKENLSYVNGNTALEPSGFMTDANIAQTVSTSNSAIHPDELIALMYALPATYRNKGAWVMNAQTLAAIRTLKDGHDNYLWQPSYQAGEPETILGQPVVEAVDMPDIGADAEPIIFGDFKRGYRIYDRLSLGIMGDPYTQRINGLVRYHARRRVGAGVVRSDAFRKLKMAA